MTKVKKRIGKKSIREEKGFPADDQYLSSYAWASAFYGNGLIADALEPYPVESQSKACVFREFGIGITYQLLPDTYRSLRGRLLYPIRNEQAYVEGFLVYNIDNEEYPYAYVPDEMRNYLLGFYQAIPYIQSAGFVYIVRDFREVLLLHSVGIKNVVASNVKAGISDSQIEILMKYTEKVILFSSPRDSDRDKALNLKNGFQRVYPFFEFYYFRMDEGATLNALLEHLGEENFVYYIHCGTRMSRIFQFSNTLFSEIKRKQRRMLDLKNFRERLSLSTELIMLRKKLEQASRILNYYSEEQSLLLQ